MAGTLALSLYTPNVKVRHMTGKSCGNRAIFKPTKEWLEKKYWEEGLTLREIGELLGISGTAVKEWFKKYRIPTRNSSQATKLSFKRGKRKRCPKCGKILPKNGKHNCHAIPEEIKERALELYNKGHSTTKIAEELGISTSVIHKILRKAGITSRYTKNIKITIPSSKEDLAYIAGILDGEGCIQVRLLKHNGSKWGMMKCEVIIVNTSKELIDWLSKKLNLDIGVRKRKNPKWKPCYYVKTTNMYEVLLLLKALLPYLIVKRKQAEEAIKLIEEYLSIPRSERVLKEVMHHGT